LGKTQDYLKNKLNAKRDRDVVQVVEPRSVKRKTKYMHTKSFIL
jgi:hypothetical protein